MGISLLEGHGMNRIGQGLLSLFLTSVAAAPVAAAAQTPDDNSVEAVVVTGSRIRVSPLDKSQAVFQIGQDDIAKTGLTSIVDVLQRVPAAGGGLNSKFNNSGNFGNPPDGGGVGAGSAELDLRYLGSRRVLVLVDGQRWVGGAAASGVPGVVDLNTIPNAMIRNVEILQEGASPIYGSDAIAGVVNILTRERQQGLELSAQVGGYGEGDGFAQDYNVSWGATEDKTSIVIGGGYFKQKSVMSADRDISLFPSPFSTSCLDGGCSSGTPLGRFIVSDPNTGNDLDLTLKAALAAGVRPTYNPLDPTGASSSFKNFTTADRFNFQPYNYIVTPSERVSLFGTVTHDFTDSVKLKVRASYVQRKSANQAAPLPLFVGPDAGNGNLLDTVSVDATNPYNPFGFTLTSGTYAFVGRRLVEAGPRHYAQTVDTWNVNASLSGDLKLGEKTWYWDVNATASRNHAEQSFTGNVNAARVQQALGPLSGCTGSCVPLNIFGGVGSITSEMLGFIGFTQQDVSQQELHDFTANLTGDLFALPAGPLAFAAGYEHRQTKGYFQPDAVVAAGLSADIPAQPAKGEIKVDEAYLELRAPLLADLPLAHRLEVSAAGRWFDYSTSGRDSIYKAGVNWRPAEDLLVRASWGQGFRAPSIGELFGAASRFDQEIVDPCSDMLGLSGGTPASATVRANCIAAGVPASGSYVQLNPQLSVITSGNNALKPETSESKNVSIVWEPKALKDASWASNGSIELAYSDIELDSAIQALSGESLLARCAELADSLACSTITRTASGQVAAITNPLINIGGIQTRAIDLNVLWSSPTYDFGRLSLRSYSTFLLEYTEIVPTATGFTEIPREGTERGSPDQAYPKTKTTLTVDWDHKAWGASASARYLSSVKETAAADNKLASRTYIDAQLRWKPAFLGETTAVAFGVNNLFDKDPPGCISCGLNNYDPNAYDAPGRYFYFRLTYRQ
ncbi:MULTISPECIES: TonB-dependent receptor domain-containing protein [unclassified Caulobacter]|uniref:TonB-dependent receptor domain-containing protein n=1 Tax=unclassified Caulobacter TaxID=2648921 RepID=UPI001E479737|nr:MULTISPECIES: TonB-dependent receptor [unclassified Caulobacter]